jgi:superfamily II DNA or RNA helicase
MPVAWRGTLQQYVGRLHRKHAGKTGVRLIDYVDGGHSVLQRMWEKRQRGYWPGNRHPDLNDIDMPGCKWCRFISVATCESQVVFGQFASGRSR